MKSVILDVEADGLDPYTAKLHCVVCKDIETGEVREFYGTTLSTISDYLSNYDRYIGHNILGYDAIILRLPRNKCLDTLVLSRLYNQARGGHSLENWGLRLGVHKVGTDIADWSVFTLEMLARCRQDVEITEKVLSVLETEGKKFSRLSIQIEHQITILLEECRYRGFKFDIEEAARLYQELYARVSEIRVRISSSFPRIPICTGEFYPRYTKDGKLFRNSSEYPYSRIEWEEFNPGSSEQVIRVLAGNWHPEEFTPTSSPKVNEVNLATITQDAPPEAKLIYEYKILNNRLSMLKTWIAAVDKDERIHGKIFHIGTPHHRCSHINPNTGNIPGVLDKFGRVNLYGKEFRQLWTASPERILVNPDATGIQNRILAHLRCNPEFTKQAISGDIHQYHADKIGEGYTRSQMKRFLYAWIRGCGQRKAGSIVLGGVSEGKHLIETFMKNNPDMAELKARAKEWARKGWYRCSDGRILQVPSEHLALDVALVGEEQAILKLTMILADQEYKKRSLDTWLVAFVHDEDIYDTLNDGETPQLVGDIWVQSLKKSGEILKINCPLDGKVGIGPTWAIH